MFDVKNNHVIKEPIKDVIRHYSFENKLVLYIWNVILKKINQNGYLTKKIELSKIFIYFYKMW